MTTTAAWAVARLIHNNATQQVLPNIVSLRYSPKELLSQFNQSSTLTVKRSLKQHRFFMYEEHAPAKLKDDNVARTITVPPNELATLLQINQNTGSDYHHYWTSPIAAAAPALANEFRWLKQLRDACDHPLLDPRGPSLWMGSSGSGTQCHYDVADNIIVQLFGTKRIRCFSPGVGVSHLHVFPDAHPRARKSQVDFDKRNDALRFPHFVDLPRPSLDVTLRPGDALEIPAFWFHHIENGRIPDDARESPEGDCDDVPSVSVNSFSLSKPMMVAQQIFQKASLRPLMMGALRGTTDDMKLAPSTLKVLGTTLIRGLRVVRSGKEEEFIRRYLLDARYDPLQKNNNRDKIAQGDSNNNHNNNICSRQTLTNEQLQAAISCVEQILPDFQHLLKEGEREEDSTGIVLLVGLHLLELWAVELVGASSVAKAWDEALS